MEQITSIIEQEIQKQVNDRITKYAEIISKRYDISLKLLLQDLDLIDSPDAPETPITERADTSLCKGIRAGNKRCKMKGKFGGYCRWHKDQKRSTISTITISDPKICVPVVEHNHTIPPLFSLGCPACTHSKKGSKENLLIDI